MLFKIIGIVGVLLISAGILTKQRKKEDVLYVLGGLCMAAYSIHLQDTIFIVLQIIFISSAVFDRVRLSRKK